MEEVKVSVVMAVYNSEQYLCQALDSVLGQTLREIEVICVDDGSTDFSFQMLKEYAALDPRVRVFQNLEESAGAALARNIGLIHARGKYVSILDSDDFFEPELLEKCYRRAEETGSDVVTYDAYVYDSSNGTDTVANYILNRGALPEKRVFSPEENAGRLFQMTLRAAWNNLYRRGFLEQNQLKFYSLHHADDLVFACLGFACAGRIAVLPERLLHYRQNNGGSQSVRRGEWPESAYLGTYRLRKELEERGLFEQYKVSFANFALEYALYYLEGMVTVENFKKLFKALQEEYLEKLGILDLRDKELESKYFAEKRRLLRDGTPEGYLFEKCRAAGPDGSICDKVPYGKKIVLYGAGAVGAEIYSEFVRRQDWRIFAWVDKGFDHKGFPVKSPESIRGLAYDYILVAIRSREGFQEICRELTRMGVKPEQIMWSDEL